MVFRTRDMLVRQRTQTINALRAHLAGHGVVAPAGAVNVERLADRVEDDSAPLPDLVREMARLYLEQIEALTSRIDDLEARLRELARASADPARLQTMPGVGPITAVAIESVALDLRAFRSGRDFSAWLGLVPRQHSTGGKPRLGRVSKMGQRDIRRLLINGAMSVICVAARRGARFLARTNARAETEDAGGHRTGQPDGAGALGDGDTRRRIPGTCHLIDTSGRTSGERGSLRR